MAVWGISILILSLTFFTYRHPPYTWRSNIQEWLRRELKDSHVEKEDDKGYAPVGIEKELKEEDKTKEVEEVEESREKESSHEEEKDEGYEDEDKTPQAKPAAPSIAVPSFTLDDPSTSTPSATLNGPFSSTPSFTLDGPSTSTSSFTLEEPSLEETLPSKPTFPALNSPQRASAGSMAPPSAPSIHQKPTPSPMGPPSKPASQMPPPAKPSQASTLSTPPTFPSANSAQRASSSTLMPPPRGPPAPRPSPSTSLMPPPRGPIPSRTPPPSTASQARQPPPRIDTPQSRKKVQLAPGFSPLDWATLSRSNLSNVSTFQRVTPSALAAHNGRKGSDAWSVFRGKVYNVTPYAGFHPGGKGELYRGAGKDATAMFMEVHPWVNWEGMLGNCLVGVLVGESEGAEGEEEGLEGLD